MLFCCSVGGVVRSIIKESHEKYKMADWLERLFGSSEKIRLHADFNLASTVCFILHCQNMVVVRCFLKR